MNMMGKPFAYILGGALLCGLAWQPAFAQTKVRLYLDYVVNGTHAPFYIAQEKGWYKEAGLDVTILPGKNTADCIKNVGTDNADFGFPDLGPVAAAVSEGMQITAVAAVINETPAGIISYVDNPVKVPKDLEGKSLAVTSFGATTIMLPALAKLAGVDMSKVKIVEMAFGAIVPSFLTGKVDASIGYYNGEFRSARDQAKKPVTFLRLSDYGVNTYANGLIVNNKFAAANPAATKAFVQVTLRGLAYTIDHVDEAIAATAKHSETPPALLKKSLEMGMSSIDTPAARKAGWGVMNKDKWASTQNLQMQFGGQKKLIPDEQLWTNKYIQD